MKELIIIIFIVLINTVAIKLIEHREIKKTERFKYLVDLFKNRVILYNNNPKKFSAYEKELSEWIQKFTIAQSEYIESTILEKNDNTSFQNLLTMLEQFAQWAEGKIE